jgi:hypothetical protein
MNKSCWYSAMHNDWNYRWSVSIMSQKWRYTSQNKWKIIWYIHKGVIITKDNLQNITGMEDQGVVYVIMI